MPANCNTALGRIVRRPPPNRDFSGETTDFLGYLQAR